MVLSAVGESSCSAPCDGTSCQYPQAVLSAPSDFINLRAGYPSPQYIAVDEIKSAATTRMRDEQDVHFFMYGVAQGYLAFRNSLAQFLTQTYKLTVDASNLMITNGSSGALDLICKRLTKPGDIVLTEDPTYFLVKHIFADYHLTVVPVPMRYGQAICGGSQQTPAATVGKEDAGVDVVELERLVKIHKPALFYTVPVGHNPSGVTTPMSVRKKVLALAVKYEFKVVADEVYQLLNITDKQLPPPYAMCGDCGTDGVVMSINSFSKVLSPALRLGWLQSSEHIIADVAASGFIRSGGGLNPLVSGIVHESITRGLLATSIQRAKTFLRTNAEAMLEAMRESFPSDVRWYQPDAGYFVMAELPESMSSRKVEEEAKKLGVGMLSSDDFGSEACGPCIRMSYSYYSPDDIRRGIHLIAKAIESVRCNGNKNNGDRHSTNNPI
eukprot:GHVS01051016.1.p1 GENE.GHVS01051016.1~~GHVS01051016.1.p1  ORF type:complete len:440 (+),score=52.15 GHVS01051016.1:139-1458(+)